MYRYAEVDTMRDRLRSLREQLFYLLTSVLQVWALTCHRLKFGLTLLTDARRMEHHNEGHRTV
jgi:hypothetical protein